jgi:hypothetical protein
MQNAVDEAEGLSNIFGGYLHGISMPHGIYKYERKLKTKAEYGIF